MDYFSKLNDNGYLVLKNILSATEKKIILKAFYNVLSKYLKISNNSSNLNFNNISLHKKLINFRKKNPRKFSDLYLELCVNASLKSIFYSKKFLNMFSKILKTKKEFLLINGFMLRLDAPFDKRNVLPWHLDASYYEHTDPFYNAGVCWMPLTNNSFDNGTVRFIPGSNKSKVNPKNLKNTRKDKHASINIKIPVSEEEKKLTKDVNASFGDAGIFHMHLKHKSGKNISKKFRLTLICRFHDTSKKFNIGKEIYIYDKTYTPYLNKNLKFSFKNGEFVFSKKS
jgi:ectoine hydroxylase-related dioxygenase (phytanoyl-CoA dioxygenase family)